MRPILCFGLLCCGLAAGLVFYFHLRTVIHAQTPNARTGSSSSNTAPPSTKIAARVANPVSSTNLLNTVAASTVREPETPLAPFDDFSAWARQFLSGNASVTDAHGQALAWKRREALLELIQANPQKALEMAVPFHWRRTLPPSVTRFFERQVDARGDLYVAIATDFNAGRTSTYRYAEIGKDHYQAFVYGDRLNQVSKRRIPIHGIELEQKLAVHSDAIRFLEPEESAALENERGLPVDNICSVSGQPGDYRNELVSADIGGEVRHFCGVDHAKLVNEQWLRAEKADSRKIAGAAGSNWTQGNKSLLYIRLNFPDDLTEPISEADAYKVMDEVNNYYTEQSYNETSLTTTVTPLLTVPQTKDWYSTAGPGALLADAREIARRAGFETDNYDRDIVSFTSVPGYDFGGLAFVRGKGVWLQSTGVGVTAHELGHNYGLWHANFWNTTNTSTIGVGTNSEYGNIFDTMGSGGVAQFNAPHKNVLGWLTDTAVHAIVTNGVYRIYPFDTPSRIDGRFYAGTIKKDFRRDYWFELRQKFTSNPWVQNGILLNWAPWFESNGGTQLLDATPGSNIPRGDTREDAPVVIGRTFSDFAAGVHITPLARDIAGSNAWVDVQVNLGSFFGNQPPEMRLEIDPPNPSASSLVHFHTSAFDPDGDALSYAWTFDDLTFSTNNLPWISKRFPTSGDHVVRCAVSDMKGGVASANTLVTIGSRSGSRISGHVLDQFGDPIEGVRVDNAATNSLDYLGGYTASDGSFIITGVMADLDLFATKYGFVFTNITWSNPIPATGDVVNVDFIATSLPNLTLKASTNSVGENDSTDYSFTLTRTGDTTTNLTVILSLSGSADLGNDFTLSPALRPGTNVVDIPAGSNTLAFTFRAINDGQVEDPETAILTIVEDPGYVAGELGTATITILDDDAASRPGVSVTSINSVLSENGMDNGTFRFTRTGSTQAPLTVFYSTSGTATPGTDYTTLLGTVVIPAGSISTTVQFQPIDDKDVEPAETVIVSLTPNASYAINGSPALATIFDDDLLTVTIFPSDNGASEPSGSGSFTIKREGDLSGNLLVFYTIAGTAVNGLDYEILTGSATIPAGAASVEVAIKARNDSLLEGDESVILALAANAAYNVGTPSTATLFLRDDEKPTVTIIATDRTASEPGDDKGSFEISRGSAGASPLTVNLAISGKAIPGADYVPLDNPVVIPAGARSITLEVIAFDDLHNDTNEFVIVTLQSSTDYNVGVPNQASVEIVDDDFNNNVPAVGFTFSSSSAEESSSPGVSVSLSVTSAAPVTVDFKVIGGTASSNDFSLPQPSPMVFNPGERAKSIPIKIVNDSTIEPNETIRLALFNPIGATLDGIKIHTYTILDDDGSSVSITATAPGASETGPTQGNFRISRAGATNSAVVVNFQVTGTASAPADYAPIGTSVTIPVGATFVDLPVLPGDDPTVEYDETVVVTLLTAPGAKIISPNIAVVNIKDNDPNVSPVVTVTSTNHPYAVEGGGNGEFLFTRNSTNGALTLFFSIAGTATNGLDYVPFTNVITIPDGQSFVSIPVIPIDDTLIEGEETVIVSLTATDSYRAGHPASAIVTIQDNDQRVRIDAGDFIAAEPGTDRGEFTFTRFGTTNTDLQVFFTISGSAQNGIDYLAISNSFAIPAGSLSAVLPIVPIDDLLVEGWETVTLTLTPNSTYALDQPTSATVTIVDDEPMLTISATVTNITEGSKPPAILRLTRTGDPKYTFTAHLAVSGTATYGVDYPPFLTNVYFSCGVTAIDLLISPTNELFVENDETVFTSILPDPSYAILSPSNALITIKDAGTNHTPFVAITSPKANLVFLPGTNANMILEATVFDDPASTNPPPATWSKVRGPDSLTFGDTNLANTTVSFTNVGVYVLRLTADNGQLQGYAELTAVVGAAEMFSSNLLHWAFDDGAGTNVLDSSGRGHNGLLSGTPVWTTNGVLNGALRFSGTNDCVRQSSGTNFLDGLKAFSISMWVKSGAPNLDQGIFTANESGTIPTLGFAAKTASCGSATNIIEATLATSRGSIRHVSVSDLITNEWQHLALSWSNGLAPALFINGQRDQPFSHMVALSGFLTNSAQFVVGKGTAALPNSWNGMIDDVLVLPRAFNDAEAAFPSATNIAALVDAGTNTTVQLGFPVSIIGTVSDDGRPNPPGQVSNVWVLVSGPAPVTITNANDLTNLITFVQSGEYVFRLISDDGQVKVYEDVTNTVIEPTRVDVFATDNEAAELGPDTGLFTFIRTGDTNFDLTVFFTLRGIASNGVDYIELTNNITFVAGADTVQFIVTPFLDHRTEGDETVIYTMISNIAYTIGNGEATVTIHDSPYGMWNIQHFTLEELTLPNLSGEGVDFDHDTLFNFAEYAANRDPKSFETNQPVVSAIELDPADSLNHIFVTYRRRLEPRDVSYEVIISNDLLTWNAGTNYVQEVQATDDGNGLTETVKARVVAPYSTFTNWFITVRTWLRATGP